MKWSTILQLRRIKCVFHLYHVYGFTFHIYGCIGASLVAQMIKNPPAGRRLGFDPCIGKIPWRRVWLPTLVFLLGELHRQRSLWTAVHGFAKSQTRLSN